MVSRAGQWVILVVSMATLVSLNSAETVVQEDKEVEQLAQTLLGLLNRGTETKDKRAQFETYSQCGGVLKATDQIKVLSTPRDASGQYLSSQECQWIISAPVGQNVELHFTLFDLEDRRWILGTCSDYLRIFDGEDSMAPHIGTYCVQETPPDVTSTRNMIFLDFYSGWFDEERGFDVQFKAVGVSPVGNTCIHQELTTGGKLMPVRSGLYSPYMTCEWPINAPQGKRIKFHFRRMSLEPTVQGLCYDYINIVDGVSLMAPTLLLVCGDTRPADLETSGNSALVMFQSDGTDQGAGFELEYTFIDYASEEATTTLGLLPEGSTTSVPSVVNLPSSCRGQVTVRTGYNGYITSPGFDEGSYPNNLECRWRIEAPPNYVVFISFNLFDVETATPCYDVLEIFDSFQDNTVPIGRYCGSGMPRDIMSTNNFLSLKFETDDSVTRRGFSLTYVVMRRRVRNTTPPPVVIPAECGKNIYTRIAGGQRSPDGMFPWQVHIRTFTNYLRMTYQQCGGSLIHAEWVLTAAHCLENSKDKTRTTDGSLVYMYFGVEDLRDLQSSNPIMRKADSIFFHRRRKDYKVGPHDIALIKLSRPVHLNDDVNIICLPPKSGIPVGSENCTVSGWGKTHHEGSTTIKLMHVNQDLISTERCQRKWYPNHHQITDTNLCAEKHGVLKGSCQGDSGGPLACRRGNKYDLAGVVSWGNPCGKSREPLPPVYTKVSYYLDWINQVVGQNS